MIRLLPIAADNLFDICELTTNPDGLPTPVEGCLCCNGSSIAEACYFPDMVPLGIYADDVPVGFVMYRHRSGESSAMLLRLMIDHRFQHRGYGRQALRLTLDRLRRAGVRQVTLGVDDANRIAKRLYASFGFVFTGTVEKGEQIYRLEWETPVGGPANQAGPPTGCLRAPVPGRRRAYE